MKEYLQQEQPIFYHLIENAFIQKKIPHAYLLVGNNTYTPLTFLAMSLLCDDTLACENCIDCQKVKDNKYGDIIRFDGQVESIKKHNIEYIQESFKKSSLEGKAKIYILENIENATKEAMNSLLKILEEPTEGIYALFTTKNINRVLPTIQSRCQVIEIKQDSKSALVKQLVSHDIELENATILAQLTNTYEEAISLFDERFEYMVLQVVNTIEDIFEKPENLVINTQTNIMMKYKAKEDVRLFLNLLAIGLKDLFHVKHSQELIFMKYKELFTSINAVDSDIIKKIEIVLETNYLLDTNANITLLMDSLMYKL